MSVCEVVADELGDFLLSDGTVCGGAYMIRFGWECDVVGADWRFLALPGSKAGVRY